MKKAFLKRLIITVVFIIVVLAILFGVWFHNVQKMLAQFEKPQPPVTVTATKAISQDWTPSISSVGTLQAPQGVDVTTKSAGQITKIEFESDQQVSKGQPLVQLSSSTLIPQIKKAEASLELAKINYKRQLDLRAQQANSPSDLDTASAQLKENEAELAYLKAQLGNLTVKAPFSGKIGIRQVNVGQYIQPGTAIASLQDTQTLYVNFYIPANSVQLIHVGQAVEVTAEAYPNKVFAGKVTALNSSLSANTRSLEVQATIPNEQHLLWPGMFVTVKSLLPVEKNIVTIPQTAVNYTLYGNSVYVVSQDKDHTVAKEQAVTVGLARDNQVQILKGLSVGEEVVTTGQMKLQNNSPIQIVAGPTSDKSDESA